MHLTIGGLYALWIDQNHIYMVLVPVHSIVVNYAEIIAFVHGKHLQLHFIYAFRKMASCAPSYLKLMRKPLADKRH